MKRQIFSVFIAIIVFISNAYTVSANFGRPSSFVSPSPSSDWDNDGLTYFQETEIFNNGQGYIPYDPYDVDTNGNGVNDGNEDFDGDGLTNLEEFNIFGTNPAIIDTDGNGTVDSGEDFDRDGYSNYAELYVFFTDPIDINSKPQSGSFPGSGGGGGGSAMGTTDRDGDGVSDYYENNFGYYDSINDSNANGILDGYEDFDNDGLTNFDEINTYDTDPTNFDTDGDGLLDGEEVNTYHTDPLNSDTDGDDLIDGEEVFTYSTNPLKIDTDGDKISDGDEIAVGLNPLNSSTHGVPDSEYTKPSTLSYDSDRLSYINSSNDYYTAISANVAGNINSSLYVSNGVYSETAYSEAIVGDVLKFSYDPNLKVDGNIRVSFKISKNSNLNIFEFFDDIGMFLPIKTTHTSTEIYADVDEFGTFVVMDLTKIVIKDESSVTPKSIDYYPPDVQTALDESTLWDKNGHRYLFVDFPENAQNIYIGKYWAEAKEYCESLGGHLVTITSQEENDFLSSLNPQKEWVYYYWIGLYNEGTSSTSKWQWVTGEELNYSNYAGGNPVSEITPYRIPDLFAIMSFQDWFGYWEHGMDVNNCRHGFIIEWDSAEYLSLFDFEKINILNSKSALEVSDKDSDGISDWNEIDNDSSLIKISGDNITFPTFQEVINSSSKSYVKNAIPNSSVYYDLLNTCVIPLKSSLITCDGDLDGIPDDYDLLPLVAGGDEQILSLESDEPDSDIEGANSTSTTYWTIISMFDSGKEPTIYLKNPIHVYSRPNAVFSITSTSYIKVKSIIYCNGEIWVSYLYNNYTRYSKFSTLSDAIPNISDKIENKYTNAYTAENAKKITVDGFAGWYFPPTSNFTGITRPIPWFMHMKYGPCLGYSVMMGDYYLRYINEDATDFFKNNQNNLLKTYYDENSTGAKWESYIKDEKVIDFNINILKYELSIGKPVVVSGRKGAVDHYVLVVGYTGNGTKNEDFVIVDPYHSANFPTTLKDFWQTYPDDTWQFKQNSTNTKDPNRVAKYPMFIFN